MPSPKSNKKPKQKNGAAQNSNNRSTKNQLRVIGGQFRGRKLSFESAQGLRPTLDQVRETLFNWLSADIHEAKCLDLFAGSGALGFEALSRGASSVTFVDNNPKAINSIESNLTLLSSNLEKNHAIKQSRTKNQTSMQFLKNAHEQFDLVFLDPPYQLGFIQQTLDKLDLIITSNTLIYIEMEANLSTAFLQDAWEVVKMKSSSRLAYGLIKRKA